MSVRLLIFSMIILLIILISLAAYVYIESIKLLEESGRVGSIIVKVELWFKSAVYLLLFTIIALIIVLFICVITHIVLDEWG